MNVAAAISAELHRRGTTQKQKQAAIVGEPPPNWSDYINGRRNPTLQKVQEWATRVGVGLVYSGGKWSTD